ncbi:MAG: asparagine synthase-related protein [Pirellulaceae bacterium]
MDSDASLVLVCERTGAISVFNDAVGYRRVFWYSGDQIFIATTRLPLLMRLVSRRWQVDRRAARVFLADREPRWPLSIVQGVATLPPVHRLDQLSGNPRMASYWQPTPAAEKTDRRAVAEELRRLLRMSVERRATGRRLAVTLSGGYDSTCLAKLMTEVDAESEALSCGYAVPHQDTDANVYNETEYAGRIAKQLGLPFFHRVFDISAVRKMMDHLPSIIDQPGHDPTSFLLLCQTARERGCDAVLSGIGGDTCFIPKTSLLKMKRYLPVLQGVTRLPLVAMALKHVINGRRLNGPWSVVAAYVNSHRPRSFFELIERTPTARRFPSYRTFLGDTIFEEMADLTAQRSPVFDAAIASCNSPAEWHTLAALWANPCEYHVDLAATQFGLQSIMPLVDAPILRFLFSHLPHQPLNNRAFEAEIVGGIPTELMLTSKSGYCLPYERWFSQLLTEDLKSLAGDERWAALELNLGLVDHYVTSDHTGSRPDGPVLDRDEAALLWRTVMLKRYVEANGLEL